ncbi:MAG: protein kinase [Pirellulales bacterium]
MTPLQTNKDAALTQSQDASCAETDDLFDALAAEFTARLRAGQRPSIEDFCRRLPQQAELLRELLPTIAAIEGVKSPPLSGAGRAAAPGKINMPVQLGDFRLVREIGRGGMGVVYEARQMSLARPVALKVLPPHVLDEKRIERFEQEARIAACLHHPHIVPVFGVGRDNGWHFYVMQLIDGQGLDHILASANGPFDPRRAAEIGRDVAWALHQAHTQDTLHRDVKPANILLDQAGHVWITDFGLAQILESNVSLSMQFAGTLRYMPPERFHGQSDARGDVYSLGITLYEMLSGQPAFDAATNLELIRKITDTELPRLKSVCPQVPRDLETIVAKATAREPAQRYATAADLAHDLARYLQDQPIHARRVQPIERAWRWCRRNRLSAAALGVAVMSLLSLTLVASIGYFRAKGLNDDLQTSLASEKESREQAQDVSATALEALDQVFTRLAPTSSLAAAFTPAGELSDSSASAPIASAAPSVSPQVAAALEELLPYYLRLAEQRGNDPRIRRQAALGLHRIGLIHARLARYDDARQAWQRASDLLQELAADPAAGASTGELATMLAAIDGDRGDLELVQERYDLSREAYERALSTLTGVAEDKLTFEGRRELARAHLALAVRERMPPAPPGRDERGPPPREGHGPPRPGFGPPPRHHGPGPEGRRGPPPRPGDHPPDDDFSRPEDEPNNAGPPLDDGRHGPDHEDGHRPPHGRPPRHEPPHAKIEKPVDPPQRGEHLQAAGAILEKLLLERPSDAQTRLLLARWHRERASDGRPADFTAAQSEFAQATELLRGLRDEFPMSPDFAFELSEALADVRPRETPPELLPAAEQQLLEALSISEALVRDHPQTTVYTAAQVHILHRLGTISRHNGHHRDAEAVYRRGLALQQKLVEQFPGVFVQAYWLARVQWSLADYLAEEHRGHEAIPIVESALEGLQPYLTANNPPKIATLAEEHLRSLLDDLQRPPRRDE